MVSGENDKNTSGFTFFLLHPGAECISASASDSDTAVFSLLMCACLPVTLCSLNL